MVPAGDPRYGSRGGRGPSPTVLVVSDHAGLRSLLEKGGFSFEDRPHARFLSRGPGVTATLYNSGKFVLNGKGAKRLVALIVDEGLAVMPEPKATSGNSGGETDATGQSKPAFKFGGRRVGIDEAGKGDYFGPLTVGAVLIRDADDERILDHFGVTDSKRIDDREIRRLARIIKEQFIHSIVRVNPPRYNELMDSMGNLNKLLGWAHARSLENILKEASCPTAISDQFGNKAYIERALMEKGRSIDLIQRPKAESDLAVAAASILARDTFLAGMDDVSRWYGSTLPRGAGSRVDAVGRTMFRKGGRQLLFKYAKMHFRTTEKIISSVERQGQ